MNAWNKKPLVDLTHKKPSKEFRYSVFVDEYSEIIRKCSGNQISILFALRKGKLDIYEIMESTGISKTTVHENLQKLIDMKLVIRKPIKLKPKTHPRFFYKLDW